MTEIGLEEGKLLYEYSDAKLEIVAPAEGGKKGVKKRIGQAYMILLAAGNAVWFLVSLIVRSLEIGFWRALLAHLPALIGVVIGGLVLILTAFSAWGKFVRFAFRRNRAGVFLLLYGIGGGGDSVCDGCASAFCCGRLRSDNLDTVRKRIIKRRFGAVFLANFLH